MAFILYFVYKVQSDHKYDNELVVSEYYKKDMRYSKDLAMMQRAEELAEKPSIQSSGGAVIISFPKTMRNSKGSAAFYRPSAQKLDFAYPLSLSDGRMVVPEARLAAGQWWVTLTWQWNGTTYMMKQNLYL